VCCRRQPGSPNVGLIRSLSALASVTHHSCRNLVRDRPIVQPEAEPAAAGAIIQTVSRPGIGGFNGRTCEALVADPPLTWCLSARQGVGMSLATSIAVGDPKPVSEPLARL
jgi:hypothetical protein